MDIVSNKFHNEILVCDAHRDVAYEAPLKKRFLQKKLTEIDLDLEVLKSGGIDMQVYAICTSSSLGLFPTAQALSEIEEIIKIIEDNSRYILLATKAEHVVEAKKKNVIAAFLSFEGAEPILTEINLLRMFFRLGLRSIGFTWNLRNSLADGSYEGINGGGLSKFGKEVVKEMNRLGMVVDIAHMTERGMYEVLHQSETPVILSHGTVGALRPGHHRAYADNILEMIAENGGLFCVTTIPEALAQDPSEASISIFIDHIDHAVKVMGINHVGLGADFDVYLSRLGLPTERWTTGLEEADKWQKVTSLLLDRGYKKEEVKKIMGENLFTLYKNIIG